MVLKIWHGASSACIALSLGLFSIIRVTTLFSSSDKCGALVLTTAPETIFFPSSVSQQYSTPR